MSAPDASHAMLRRRLLAGGAGVLASAGLGMFGRSALAQSGTIEQPFIN